MKSSTAHVKHVKFEMGYGGCKAPAKPVPIWLPGAVALIVPPTLPRVRRPKGATANQ